jgi:hypothetical protein
MIDPEFEIPELSLPPDPVNRAPMVPPRGHRLSDADVALLVRLEGGETTFRPSSPMLAGDSIEQLVGRLIALRDRGLVELSDSRIMRNQAGRILGAGPCGLTPAGHQALAEDRRLGPHS